MKHILIALTVLLAVAHGHAQLPEGFARETILTDADGIYLPVGYIPIDTNLAYIYQMDGTVMAVLNDEVLPEPVLDIREECGFWSSNGLLGAAIDPNFKENGFIYLLYNVDRHHYIYYGTPEYDPEASSTWNGGMGRISRFTVNTEDYLSTDPESRHVLLGENIGEGIPIASDSHSTCSLVFGDDGSLIAGTGDGNTWQCCYTGVGALPSLAFDSTSLADGVLSQEEMIGAFRSQFPDGLNGKLIRIHPETGEGLPNNPYFDPENPSANRSKWWATGFRNPYRMKIRPESGWGNLTDGHPGTLYVGDVGNAHWEELNIIKDGGGNYGWPLFEGHGSFVLDGNNGPYPDIPTMNYLAQNPLFETGGCSREYFTFQDLIQQQNQQHDYYFPNPCDQSQPIPEEILTFEHERPAMAYRNYWAGGEITMFPTFDALGEATATRIEDMDEIDGESFIGTSIIGGDFLTGESIPEEFQNHYVFADYLGWIRAIEVDENDEIKSSKQWQPEGGSPVDLTFNPYSGCLYITSLVPLSVDRICFGGNLRPVPVTDNDTIYGSSPLTVEFDGSESFDPEGGSVTHFWDFADDTTSDEPTVTHSFENELQQAYRVTLTVTDSAGAANTKEILVSLNNTPPSVQITSIEEGELYPIDFPTSFELLASISDQENPIQSELSYEWSHLLHHNTHFHVLHEYDFITGATLVNPTGCGEGDTYWYEINVTVTDPGGLTAFDSKMIYPDCQGELKRNLEEDITLFPNPTEEKLTVLIKDPRGNSINLRIIDSSGRLIRQEIVDIFNGRQFFSIDVQVLQKGVYTLELELENGRKQKKFVKM